jgi:hypothetical protein
MGLSTQVTIIQAEVSPTKEYPRREYVRAVRPDGQSVFWYSYVGGWIDLEGQTLWIAAAIKRRSTSKGMMLGTVRKVKGKVRFGGLPSRHRDREDRFIEDRTLTVEQLLDDGMPD